MAESDAGAPPSLRAMWIVVVIDLLLALSMLFGDDELPGFLVAGIVGCAVLAFLGCVLIALGVPQVGARFVIAGSAVFIPLGFVPLFAGHALLHHLRAVERDG
jgi:hypothetical protein